MKTLKITSVLVAVIIATGFISQLQAQKLTGKEIIKKVPTAL